MTTENSGDNYRRLSLWVLIFSVAQALAPSLSAVTGTGTPIGEQPEFDTLVTPADYAFVIWTFIFPATIAYGVFQRLAAQRDNRLLGKIRGCTLLAFAACTLWSIAAQYLWLWLTVVLMIGILSGLIGALAHIIKRDEFSTAETAFVVVPISVYTGWITVATVANTASWLKAAGFSDFIVSDQTWAIVLITLAGAIASMVTRAARGNAPYALTVVWGLVGIAVANFTEQINISIVGATAAMIVVIAATLILTRTKKIYR